MREQAEEQRARHPVRSTFAATTGGAVLLRRRFLSGPVLLDPFSNFLDGRRAHLLLSGRSASILRNRCAPHAVIPAIAQL